jgi:hypothetical protein
MEQIRELEAMISRVEDRMNRYIMEAKKNIKKSIGQNKKINRGQNAQRIEAKIMLKIDQ